MLLVDRVGGAVGEDWAGFRVHLLACHGEGEETERRMHVGPDAAGAFDAEPRVFGVGAEEVARWVDGSARGPGEVGACVDPDGAVVVRVHVDEGRGVAEGVDVETELGTRLACGVQEESSVYFGRESEEGRPWIFGR